MTNSTAVWCWLVLDNRSLDARVRVSNPSPICIKTKRDHFQHALAQLVSMRNLETGALIDEIRMDKGGRRSCIEHSRLEFGEGPRGS